MHIFRDYESTSNSFIRSQLFAVSSQEKETTERPEGIEAGTARLVGTDRNRIVAEIFSLLDDKDAYDAMARAHNPFGDGRAAERIAEIVARAHR